ncbi:MAG TPA: hypothetical protein ENH03_01240 [Candidatus Bathyarchaeota archaeon]|nr:hypothetical protein [Candidatus Bathyarchaeota archaeon]
MPLFLAIHKWKKEDNMTVTRKVLEVLRSLPEDICPCFSYVGNLEAWCIYKAKSKEAGEKIKEFFEQRIPEMETEVKPVLQFYPPSPDIYTIIHTLVATQ